MTEEEDFLERHWKAVAEELNRSVVHRPDCDHGKRKWQFTWCWPFVRTWISRSLCVCKMDTIPVKQTVQRIDFGGLSPRQQKKAIQEWTRYWDELALRDSNRLHREAQQCIDEIGAILTSLMTKYH